MFEKQVTALTAILKDTDIQSYAGDGFWNIIKAVSLGDAGALLDSANDIKNLVFHAPTVLFWDKRMISSQRREPCFKIFDRG